MVFIDEIVWNLFVIAYINNLGPIARLTFAFIRYFLWQIHIYYINQIRAPIPATHTFLGEISLGLTRL